MFDGLDATDIAYIDEKTHQKMVTSEVFSYDILLNITGASIGRCCFVPEHFPQANSNQHVCCIRRPNATKSDAQFLSEVLSSHIGQRQIFRLNAGGNREGLNFQQLRSFVVPWPECGERTTIAIKLDALTLLYRSERKTLHSLKELKTGLMQDLLTGKVRVSVDETEEVTANV